MPHILVAGRLHPSGQQVLNSAPGVSVRFIEEISEESYIPYIHEADALLVRTQRVSADTVEKAGRLRIVSRHGVGYDAVDVAALNKRGIALAVCGDVNSTSVAEHAIMMLLASYRRALRGDAAVRGGRWDWRERLESREVWGTNLLLVGYGRIGRRTGDLAVGFGMKTRAFDPFLLRQGWPQGGAEPVDDLHDALAWADAVSISIPHTERPIIGAAEFAVLKNGAILVNTARGSVVDESELIKALRSGRVAAAGLDVFAAEPLAATHPLCEFDQVLLSPHVAGMTAGAAERMAVSAARNIVDYLDGVIDPSLVVNREHVHVAQKS